VVNISSVEEKLLFPQEMFYQSIKFLKVQPYAILNHQSGTKDLIQDAQEHMPLLLDTQKMDLKLELDYHQEPEKLFQEVAEQQSELLPVEVEIKNQL